MIREQVRKKDSLDAVLDATLHENICCGFAESEPCETEIFDRPYDFLEGEFISGEDVVRFAFPAVGSSFGGNCSIDEYKALVTIIVVSRWRFAIVYGEVGIGSKDALELSGGEKFSGGAASI